MQPSSPTTVQVHRSWRRPTYLVFQCLEVMDSCVHAARECTVTHGSPCTFCQKHKVRRSYAALSAPDMLSVNGVRSASSQDPRYYTNGNYINPVHAISMIETIISIRFSPPLIPTDFVTSPQQATHINTFLCL